ERFGQRDWRQFNLAAAAADREYPALEQTTAQLDVPFAVPDLLERGLCQIADFNPDERTEVHLAGKRHARVKEWIQAAALELGAGGVVVVDQLRVDLRAKIKEHVPAPALLLERRDLLAHDLDIESGVRRDEGGN